MCVLVQNQASKQFWQKQENSVISAHSRNYAVFLKNYLAEREGFEPSVRLPVQRFSRPSRSTTPASFLKPSAKLRLFSEKHHFYPIFFNQKVGQAEKRARFTLSTNHQQIVIRQPLFSSPTFQVARFRINTSRTFGG